LSKKVSGKIEISLQPILFAAEIAKFKFSYIWKTFMFFFLLIALGMIEPGSMALINLLTDETFNLP
jgi:hypothetical protein